MQSWQRASSDRPIDPEEEQRSRVDIKEHAITSSTGWQKTMVDTIDGDEVSYITRIETVRSKGEVVHQPGIVLDTAHLQSVICVAIIQRRASLLLALLWLLTRWWLVVRVFIFIILSVILSVILIVFLLVVLLTSEV
eukprot:scpid42960/ scgid28956/ 